MQRLWVSGYRNYELNTLGDQDPKIKIIKLALTQRLTTLLDNSQLDWVITGANLGVEQWASEVAIELRKEYPLRVAMLIPYEEFASRWNEVNQSKFLQLKKAVDFFAATSNQPYQSPVQLRNYQNFMLLHTDRALLLYDEEQPGKPQFDYHLIKKYQETKEYPLDLIDFYDLQDTAEEYQSDQEDQFNE
ncbi:DUF1273 domain-containing protein [Lactobacillus xylocopicola]|uniref:UPF0398 protein KIM322_07640 n=1 Tax=Lactobacillus xylocopicola TaxID=2976676 RepID=A0ABM8BGV1_9LACO|nr:DUF1273 domain-containing protein [Lactobacillus xylocopicola]BDR60503.1 UPF0398 protein [Lactobacillus xylocopicola]